MWLCSIINTRGMLQRVCGEEQRLQLAQAPLQPEQHARLVLVEAQVGERAERGRLRVALPPRRAGLCRGGHAEQRLLAVGVGVMVMGGVGVAEQAP